MSLLTIFKNPPPPVMGGGTHKEKPMPGIPAIGFYFHYPTREVFYMGHRAGWIVPCSDSQADIASWRFVADDDLYGNHSASNMGSLIQYMKGHIVRVHRKVFA